VAGPWVTDREVGYVADAAAHGWYEHAGDYVQKFEDAFARRHGVAHAIAVPHCTAALHLSLAALGIGPGDEVVVPELTWIATAAPISYVGATPVFADVDPGTWCMTADTLEACITPRTKAVIPVDLYGLTADMAPLRAVAERHGVLIVEDAAQAVGSLYRGKPAGTLGDVGTFSFHGTKTMTTGEGGMLVTDRTDVYERSLVLRDHGRTKEHFRFFYNTEIAFKYRMSNMQAAFGLAQLERLDDLVTKKRQIFRWYQQRLASVPGLQLNAEPADIFQTFWMCSVVLDAEYGVSNRELMAMFAAASIDTRPFFHPLSGLPAYATSEQAAAARSRNRVAYAISGRGLNLPSALMLTEQQVDRVCEVLTTFLRGRTPSPQARRAVEVSQG
jgi:perosamine synthetase